MKPKLIITALVIAACLVAADNVLLRRQLREVRASLVAALPPKEGGAPYTPRDWGVVQRELELERHLAFVALYNAKAWVQHEPYSSARYAEKMEAERVLKDAEAALVAHSARAR